MFRLRCGDKHLIRPVSSFYICILCLMLLFPGTNFAQGSTQPLIDRLLMEINRFSYTQRQMELHQVIKSAIVLPEMDPPVFVTAVNWSGQIQAFKNDKMVEQEAQRLSGFIASKKMVNSASDMILKKQAKFSGLRKFFQRMAVNNQEIRVVLSSVLRVQGYILSKGQRGYVGNYISGKDSYLMTPWFKKLKKRVTYRMYAEGREYKKINPNLIR